MQGNPPLKMKLKVSGRLEYRRKDGSVCGTSDFVAEKEITSDSSIAGSPQPLKENDHDIH